MIPNISRGGSSLKLASYLIGKGRKNEHTGQHLVGGSPELMLSIGDRPLVSTDAGTIAKYLDEPMRVYGQEVTSRVKDEDGKLTADRVASHVWHTSLSLPVPKFEESTKTEILNAYGVARLGELTDAQWREVAERYNVAPPVRLDDDQWSQLAESFLRKMGMVDQADVGDVRWAAVRHGIGGGGQDHIHLAVNLVREDGTIASVTNDRPRAQTAARELRAEFGLPGPEGPARDAGERGIKKGELESDQRRGLDVGEQLEHPERGSRRLLERAVRACATAARDEAEFVELLRAEGVRVLPRYANGSTSVVTGYSVALAPAAGEKPAWYSGLRLSRELTLPRLRANWPALTETETVTAWAPRRPPAPGQRTLVEPTAAQLDEAAVAIADLRDRVREIPPGESGTWVQVSQEAAGVLSAWSLRVEPVPGPIAAAAREVARSAQVRAPAAQGRRWTNLPPAQNTAQLLLAMYAGTRYTTALMVQLVDLAAALREAHEARGESARAAQLAQLAQNELTLAQAADQQVLARQRARRLAEETEVERPAGAEAEEERPWWDRPARPGTGRDDDSPGR